MTNWISVKEKLPDKDGRYFVYVHPLLVRGWVSHLCVMVNSMIQPQATGCRFLHNRNYKNDKNEI